MIDLFEYAKKITLDYAEELQQKNPIIIKDRRCWIIENKIKCRLCDNWYPIMSLDDPDLAEKRLRVCNDCREFLISRD